MANPYTVQTWTDGVSQTTAARMTVMEQGILDAHFQATCRASRNTNLAVTSSTETDVTMPNESWDLVGGATSTQHDTSTNSERLIARVAGKYLVTGFLEYQANATSLRYLLLHKNTTEWSRNIVNNLGAGNTWVVHTDIVDLAVNDYVKYRAYQPSGSTLNIVTAAIVFVRVG